MLIAETGSLLAKNYLRGEQIGKQAINWYEGIKLEEVARLLIIITFMANIDLSIISSIWELVFQSRLRDLITNSESIPFTIRR